MQWTTHFKQAAQANPRDPLPEHQAVHDAIARRSVRDATDAMKHLLALALDDMELRTAS